MFVRLMIKKIMLSPKNKSKSKKRKEKNNTEQYNF